MEKRNMLKLSIRSIFPAILIFQFCVTFLFQDFGISMSWTLAFILAFVTFEVLESLILGKISVSKRLLPSFMMAAIIFIENLREFNLADTTRVYIFLSVGISVMGLLFVKDSDQSYKFCEKSVIYTGILFSLLMISYQVYPALYKNLFLPHFSEEAAAYFRWIVGSGYGAPVGSSLSYSLFLMNFSILFLLFGDYKISAKHQFLNVGASILVFTGVALSQRRTEFVCLLLSVAIGYLFVKPSPHAVGIVVGMLGALCLVMFLLFPILSGADASSNRLVETFLQIKKHQDITNGRSDLYAIAWREFLRNPLFGIGWMNFVNYASLSGNTLARNVHNIYLQLYTECGLFLGTLFIALMFWNLRYALKNVRKGRANMAPTMMLLYILCAGMLDNTIYYTFVWPVYVTCVHMSVLHKKRPTLREMIK